jgi:hypothetical protein
MHKLIPWDVWVAGAMAAAIALFAIFDPAPAIFTGAGLAFVAYMVVEILDGELS